ncbi:MAG: cell division protein FtsA [Caldilineaceae bacterium]
MQETISAIDIGTTKVCVLTAAVVPDSLGKPALEIMGQGQVASQGIRRGMIINVDDAVACVGEAIEKCEQASGHHVLSAYVGVAGNHINTLNSKGVSPVDARTGVTGQDMQRALEGARAVALPENQEIIHTIARKWIVDGQSEVQHPLGMSAYRLEVDAHIVTGSTTALTNMAQCVLGHNIDIDELVLEPLAANEAVLRPEERQMGVAVIDIGGGTTDVAVFADDGLTHTFILNVGGNHLTNDIAYGLHAPFETAEELKIHYGTVLPERVAEDEKVWASVFGEKAEQSFSRHFITTILEARATEIFELIRDELEKSGNKDRLPAGVVLTGGANLLPGMTDLARSILGVPTRLGAPSHRLPIAGLNRTLQTPAYATTVGLLLWGLHEDSREVHRRFVTDQQRDRQDVVRSVLEWLQNLLP